MKRWSRPMFAWMLFAGMTAFSALALAGCPRPGPQPNEPIPDDPVPSQPIPRPSGGIGSQEAIIEALRPLESRNLTASEVSAKPVRIYLNEKLFTTASLATIRGGNEQVTGEFLIPIRHFYNDLDDMLSKSTVVYWVPTKRRVLVAKKALDQPIVIINKTGYVWPKTIRAVHNWNVLTNLETREIEFSS